MFNNWDININLWDLGNGEREENIRNVDDSQREFHQQTKKEINERFETNLKDRKEIPVDEDIILKQLSSKKKKRRILKFVFFSFLFLGIILAGIWVYFKRNYIADILWLKWEIVKTVIKEKIVKVTSKKQSNLEEKKTIDKSSFTWDFQNFYFVYLQDYNLLIDILKNYPMEQKKKLLIRYNLIIYNFLKNKNYLSFKKNYINFWYKILKKSWKNKK